MMKILTQRIYNMPKKITTIRRKKLNLARRRGYSPIDIKIDELNRFNNLVKNKKKQMVDITLPYNFSPRDYQIPQYEAMDNGILRVVKCWHRRAGKDLCDWNYLIKRASMEPGGS